MKGGVQKTIALYHVQASLSPIMYHFMKPYHDLFPDTCVAISASAAEDLFIEHNRLIESDQMRVVTPLGL